MPVVYEDLDLPGGEPAFSARVTYTLVGDGGEPVDLAYNEMLQTIVGVRNIRSNSIGRTTITLEGNLDITPAGTRWRRELIDLADPSENTPGIAYILVPQTGGPYNLLDLLSVIPPGVVDPDAEALLQAEIDALEIRVEDLESAEVAGEKIFIQDLAPVGAGATYLWIQTNYEQPGDMTFWVNDGD